MIKNPRKFEILFFGFSPPKVLRKNTRHSESPLGTNETVLTFFGLIFTHLTAHVLLGAWCSDHPREP